MVIVVADQDNDQGAKEMAYNMKEVVARLLAKPGYHINKSQYYVAVQASPERRMLFQFAGRFSGIFAELSGDDKLQTKREYGQDNLTILGWSVNEGSGDKNSHLQRAQGSSSGGGGRWRRVAEWGRRTQWRIFALDCVRAHPGTDCRRATDAEAARGLPLMAAAAKPPQIAAGQRDTTMTTCIGKQCHPGAARAATASHNRCRLRWNVQQWV